MLPRRIKRPAKLAPGKVVTTDIVILEKNGPAAAVNRQLATASLTAIETNPNQSKHKAPTRRRMPAQSRMAATAMQTITMENSVDGVGGGGPAAAKDASAKNVATAVTAATTATIAKNVVTGAPPAGKTTDRTDQPSTCPHANGLPSSWMLPN